MPLRGRERDAGRGGAGRGQGRKTTAFRNARQCVEDGSQSVGAMLGMVGDKVQTPAAIAMKKAFFAADVIKWTAEDNDGNEVAQKQVKGGLVTYTIDSTESDQQYILVKEGSQALEEYWLDSTGAEVPQGTHGAMKRTRGGNDQVFIRRYGESEGGMWVGKGHVLASTYGKAAAPVSVHLGKRRIESSSSDECSDDEHAPEHDTAAQPGGADDDETGEAEDETGEAEDQPAESQCRPVAGAGRKAALRSSIKKKRKQRRECKAKGHSFQPKWLQKYDWLRTEPDLTFQEWEMKPSEAPAYMYCVCCVQAFPTGGQKDVLTRKVAGSLRGDKLVAHWKGKPAHARAYMKWKKAISSAEGEGVKGDSAAVQVDDEDKPFASLIRTVMVTCVSKCAIRMVNSLVKLQLANECVISQTYLDESRKGGVQQLMHAAASILRRKQEGRLRHAKIFSLMGDGSTDRKTIEQVSSILCHPSHLQIHYLTHDFVLCRKSSMFATQVASIGGAALQG